MSKRYLNRVSRHALVGTWMTVTRTRQNRLLLRLDAGGRARLTMLNAYGQTVGSKTTRWRFVGHILYVGPRKTVGELHGDVRLSKPWMSWLGSSWRRLRGPARMTPRIQPRDSSDAAATDAKETP